MRIPASIAYSKRIIAGMRMAFQYVSNLQCQAIHGTPHVGVADC
jgi:hypothetical protein